MTPDPMTHSNDPQTGHRLVLRAADDLRRGWPVTVTGHGRALLVLPLERADDAALADFDARLARLGGTESCLLLTDQRALTLKVAAKGWPVVRLARAPWLTAADMTAIADPTLDLGSPMKGPFRRLDVAPAVPERAAVKLIKIARLLPAALIADLPGQAFNGDDAAAGGVAGEGGVPGPDTSGPASGRSSSDQPGDRVSGDADPGDTDPRATGLGGLMAVDGDAVLAHDMAASDSLVQVARAHVPLVDAVDTTLIAFRPRAGGPEHIAILVGDPPRGAPVLARLHSECFTGDLLGSLKCDCGPQLKGALKTIGDAGGGVILYLAQEGRGIGLISKLKAYSLQDQGFDTVDANTRLGFDVDERMFAPAARMLKSLGFSAVRLLTNNPEKVAALTRFGIDVAERVAHSFPPNPHNEAYLAVKKARTGHLL